VGNLLASDLDHILQHTKGLWDEMRDKRIFITGGTGFIGCWLLESFAWANDKLHLKASAIVLTRNPAAFQRKAPHLASHPAIYLHAGDVRSFEFPEGEFYSIIHAATEASSKQIEEQPLLMFDTIVEGTRHTLELARRCCAKKFLLISSGGIYGKHPPEITHLPEEYYGAPNPMDKRSAYAEGKRAAEMLCAIYSEKDGLETKIARCFAFVGPYLPLNSHFAIGNFIRDGLLGGPIQVKGDGTPCRSYLYSADLVIWLWTMLFRAQSCRPYNIGAEYIISIEELAHLVASCFKPVRSVHVALKAPVGQSPERYIPSVRRAMRELDLRQAIDLREAVTRTIRWYSHTMK